MPLKAFDSSGTGYLSAEIEAIQYANASGAVVISNSWGGGNDSQSLKDVIDAYPGVVVCAAGNGGPDWLEDDNDAMPFYPASYSSPNIIAVAATDYNDALATKSVYGWGSNYGATSVDLAAPGTNILSTNFDGNYDYKQGTSMATPHVSGVAALVKAVNQSLSSAEIKTIILSTVDAKSSLSGKVATGGRLNAYNAILATPPAVPVADFSGVPTSGTGPMPVSFTDLSLNNPTGWVWYFGDETYTVPWTEMNASAGWSGRWGHSSVAMPDGSIVLMGGDDGVGIKSDVWRSTDNGATWTEMNASAGWTGRAYHSSVAMPDGSIILMGGDDGVGIKSDVWRSMDNGVTWTQVNASAGWTGRVYHSSIAMPDGSIVLMGGFGIGGYKNDTWRSMDNGATWTQVNASAGWLAREYHSSVAMLDGSIVLMGGTDNYGYSYLNDVWRSTDSGESWTQVNANAGWSARFLHSSVVMPDGSLVLMGGFGSDGYKNDVWRSTDDGAMWIQLNASAGWTARWDHKSVVMPDGSIVLIGGVDGSAYKNDVWRFNPVGSSAQNPSYTYTTPGTYPVAQQVYNSVGYNSTRKTGYITVMGSPAPVADFTGVPTSGTAPLTVVFTDNSTNKPTTWNWSFGDGNFSTTQDPDHTYQSNGTYTVALTATNDKGSNRVTKSNYIIVGNISRIGVYRPSTHLYYQDYNGNGVWDFALVDRAYNFGIVGDIPVSGDWNADGRTEIGVYRPSTHLYYQDYNGNGVWNGALIDKAYNFGIVGDVPVSGDWNADGGTEIGFFQNVTHLFYLDYNGNGAWNGTVTDREYNFGIVGDIPVTGDWNADGRTEIGVYRPSTHLYYQDYNGNGVWNGALIDKAYNFGITGDLPVSGDWDGDWMSEIGVYRPSTHLYYQDYNGNGVWNGSVIDRAYNFGITGDTPVSGKWV
jgi:PKD repeat protein